jgi:hypothetical protein
MAVIGMTCAALALALMVSRLAIGTVAHYVLIPIRNRID